MPEKRQFFRGDVENAAVLAAFFASASYSALVASDTREKIRKSNKWSAKHHGRHWNSASQSPSNCRAGRWPSLFSPLRQPALEQFQGTEPAGCSFWRHASAGKPFFSVPENHFNCAVGANTHNIPLSPARERETEQHFENDVRSGLRWPGGSPADSAARTDAGGDRLRPARGCAVHAGCCAFRLPAGGRLAPERSRTSAPLPGQSTGGQLLMGQANCSEKPTDQRNQFARTFRIDGAKVSGQTWPRQRN